MKKTFKKKRIKKERCPHLTLIFVGGNGKSDGGRAEMCTECKKIIS